MATIALDQANFDQQVLTEGIVMVDCWAPWCQGCGEFEPVFDAASERHPAHTFAKVNTKTEGELTKKLEVTAHKFSQTARERIEAAGGRCEVVSS